jgi:hypothetical protein
MLAVTIGTGGWRKAAEVSAQSVREHTGLETRILGDAEWKRYQDRYPHPAFLKFHLFDLVDDDNVFYFDADTLHLQSWEPQQFANREELVAVVDTFVPRSCIAEAQVDAADYFNTGIMILNRRCHAEMLDAARRSFESGTRFSCFEQSHLNWARKQGKIRLTDPGPQFNRVSFHLDDDAEDSSTVIAHFNGLGKDPGLIEIFAKDRVLVHQRTAAAEAAKFIEKLEPTAPPSYAGRGIVICAGGIKYNTCAYVLVRLLKHLDCRLPIQVWYRGDEEYDPGWIKLMTSLGVECVDAEAIRRVHPHACLGGWQLKAFAVMHSPFQEVLLLDADNIPVRDPEYLFESVGYQETGALFWPDGCKMPINDPCWEAFGVPFQDERNFESGQAIIDKSRCWRALALCDWYNQHSYFFYRVVYGDKDTFRFAWRRLGQPFSMPRRDVEAAPRTLLQYDPAGELIFQHRYGDKWRFHGNVRLPAFIHEDRCHAYLEELRRCWNPLRRTLDTLAAADREAMDRLHDSRFLLIRPGYNRWSIQLARDGWISSGWHRQSSFWWVQAGSLMLAGENCQLQYRLRPNATDGWEGRNLTQPAMRLILQFVPL